MTRKLKVGIIAAGALAALGGGAAIAGVGGDDDGSEKPISGSALDSAKSAALAEEPGRVTETETGDEESYYEVEVTRSDGSQVDVQLDRDFNVVGSEDDGSEDEGSENDD